MTNYIIFGIGEDNANDFLYFGRACLHNKNVLQEFTG